MRSIPMMAAAACVAAAAGLAHAQMGDVYMFDIRATPEFFRVSLADPATRTFINPGLDYTTFAMDFDSTATTLYAIHNTNRTLGTIDPDTGAFTAIAPVTGVAGATDTFIDLTIGPDNGAYLAAGANLYSFNLATGAATLIAPFSNTNLVIDLAIDRNGVMYAHDIGTDSLLTINTTTGAATTIGTHGLAANFAQGMDFDWSTNTLYATIYTGGGTGQFVSWNTANGSITTLVDTGLAGWNMEIEMAVRSPIPAPGAAGIVGLAAFAGIGRRRR